MKLTEFVDLRAMANALRATLGMKKLDPPRPTKGVGWTRRTPGGRAWANVRGDGYDQDRLDAARAKRERRCERNLRNQRRGGYVR